MDNANTNGATGMNTNRDSGEYNVSLWRVDAATGEVISVCAGRFVGGRILRASGTWTHANGLPEYHEEYLRGVKTFAGSPCNVVVTRGTKGFKNAIGTKFALAFANATADTIATF